MNWFLYEVRIVDFQSKYCTINAIVLILSMKSPNELNQVRLVEKLADAQKKLEEYDQNDEVVLSQIKAFAERIELELAGFEDDTKSLEKTIIINGIYETTAQSKLAEQFQQIVEDGRYSIEKILDKMQQIVAINGASLRDLLSVYLVVLIGHEYYGDMVGDMINMLLKRYKSKDLDKIIIENFGKDFFKESLAGADILNGSNGNGFIAGQLLGLISDKNFLLENFNLFTKRLTLSPKKHINGSILQMIFSEVAENLVSDHLEDLSFDQVHLLIDGIKKFGQKGSYKNEILRKLKFRLYDLEDELELSKKT